MISFFLALLELLVLVQAAVQGSAHSLLFTFFHTRMSKLCFMWQAGSFPLALLGLGSPLFPVIEFPGSFSLYLESTGSWPQGLPGI